MIVVFLRYIIFRGFELSIIHRQLRDKRVNPYRDGQVNNIYRIYTF